MYKFDTCNLALSGNLIGMMVSRQMTQSDDGLNHQGGYACVIDAETLKFVKGHGQTSGHSFANSLIVKEDKEFGGMDLGDNYPRGINCWSFNDKSMNTQLAYTFKTLHGDQSKSMAGVQYPEYTQISSASKKFYKWSNDNKTYTELAAPGLAELPTGVMVVFCG